MILKSEFFEMIKNDTIAAISTGMQTAAVGIIRISGKGSLKIIKELFHTKIDTKDFKASRLYLGDFCGEGFIDKCMCAIFKAPNSYTGEDMAEIHCHGGLEVVRGVLQAVLNSGARLADCGEFTRRAFVNGKTDLSSAEGIIEMIDANSKAELIAVSKLAQGELFKKTTEYQSFLTDTISSLEVSLDYPEEDLNGKKIGDYKKELEELCDKLSSLRKTYTTGKMLRDGIELVICGVTNAGKSSLINTLLNFDRSIVTDIKGTTRDTVEEYLEIEGVKFKIIDTAGIRETFDKIESLGIERSLSAINSAGIILYVVDPETYLDSDNVKLKEKLDDKNFITVLNKTDLNFKKGIDCDIEISAKENINIDKLKKIIIEKVKLNNITDSFLITSQRHFNALNRSIDSLKNCIDNFEEKPLDIIAFELKNIWDILGEITGTSATEEIIDNIFSKFCLGK